jgi:Ca-activated chloride channel family protein
MIFQDPSRWVLLLLLLVPLMWWRWARGRRSAISYSGVELLTRAGVTWTVRLRGIVPVLHTAGLVLLIVCVARPQRPNERTRIITEGIAIQLIVDRSGSMRALDFEIDGKPANRLAAVRDVVEEFVVGGDALPGRPDDLVGLISFATYADSVCPMTLDHTHLIDAVRETEVSDSDEDQATAIGDAIALGVERMRGLDDRDDVVADRRIASRVMILLTDGESNAGDIDPLTAADMAAAFGIRIGARATSR